MGSRSGVGSAVGAVAVALAVLSGCGGDGDGGGADESPTPTRTQQTPSPSPTDQTTSPSPTETAQATVRLDSVDDLGEVLTGAGGRTLYLFEADTSEESTCYNACAEAWPPLTVSGTPQAGEEVNADLLGVTERRNGETQVTYDGHPLYYFAADDTAGETAGQGIDQFGGLWWAVDASGQAVRGGRGGDGQDQDGEEDGGSTTGGY